MIDSSVVKVEFAVEQFLCNRDTFVDTLNEPSENVVGERQVSLATMSSICVELGANSSMSLW